MFVITFLYVNHDKLRPAEVKESHFCLHKRIFIVNNCKAKKFVMLRFCTCNWTCNVVYVFVSSKIT